MIALTMLLDASGFCGTYVGTAGTLPGNRTSRMAVVRQDSLTVLTMENDVIGDLDQLGLLIPIPYLIDAEDVATVDVTLLDALDRYTAPRLVSYTCENVDERDETEISGGCMSSGRGQGATLDPEFDSGMDLSNLEDLVVVENFTVGEYEVSLLATPDVGPLMAWLDTEGFTAPAQSVELLAEYVDSGSYFLAARVSAEAIEADVHHLTPLQIRYFSDTLSLPIRLGTLNSQGVQDLVLMGITRYEEGELRISNFPEVEMDGDCMLEPYAGFGEIYEDLYSDALDLSMDGPLLDPFDLQPMQPIARWAVEHSWGEGDCDPCVELSTGSGPERLSTEVVRSMGYIGNVDSVHITRLHMRYEPSAVIDDLMLYPSFITGEEKQLRYVEYDPRFLSRFEVCGEGWLADAGEPVCEVEDLEDAGYLCSSTWVGFGIIGLTGLLRRRKRSVI